MTIWPIVVCHIAQQDRAPVGYTGGRWFESNCGNKKYGGYGVNGQHVGLWNRKCEFESH